MSGQLGPQPDGRGHRTGHPARRREGLVRGLATTHVRPEAIAVLKEVGIDISGHRSTSVSEIPSTEADTVITLCGEEECPLFLGEATRLHWGLPEPAACESAEDILAKYRAVRDELRCRIAGLENREWSCRVVI